jgi:hypothetical protein
MQVSVHRRTQGGSYSVAFRVRNGYTDGEPISKRGKRAWCGVEPMSGNPAKGGAWLARVAHQSASTVLVALGKFRQEHSCALGVLAKV